MWGGQPGGTDWYRTKTPGAALARVGWDVEHVDHLDVTVDGRVAGDPDVLVLCRVADTYLPDAVRRIVACGRTTVVYDIDDAFFAIPKYNPASKVPAQHIQVMHDTMREADLVTVSTPGLAAMYKGLLGLRSVRVLPNCLDPDLWADVDRYRQPHDRVHVGWLAAWKWRGGDVDVLRPWLKGWLATRPDVRFVALGCPEIGPELGIQVATLGGDAVRPFEHLPAMVSTLDVGIAPLTTNDFNVRAKSHIKAMEYGAAGVPCVASPSEAYRRYIRPGVNGYLARNSRQWPQLLDRTISRLDSMRDGARRVAGQHFIDQHIHRWVDAYSAARLTKAA